MLLQSLIAAWQVWLREQQGQGMVEYGLILALIAVVVIATLTSLGGVVKNVFCNALNGMGGTCP